ncbi:MAG: protein TolA [Xanthobacteraceae bacterium]
MKTGLTISVIGHAAALLWCIVSFGTKPPPAMPVDSLPLDIISVTEFSELMAGSKAAPKAPAPKPLVEKIAEPKPVDNPAQKVVDKPEIVTASALMPEAPPEPKLPEPKPAPVPQARPEPKPHEAEKKPEPTPDPIAEALKKDAIKKPEPKKEEAKIPVAQKKPPQPQPKFDPKQIEQRLALLDKRTPQRQAAAGDTLNTTAALGTSTGTAPRLSQNELDALRARLAQCWTLPSGATDAQDLNVEVHILLRQDGSLSAEPKVLNRSTSPFFQVAAESALRAVRTCAPFDFLPVAKYEAWKDIEVNFNPQYMFRS